MSDFSTPEWIGISLLIIIMGMSRGGLPIAGVALPLLVLIRPEQGQAARSAVSFMLPLIPVGVLIGYFIVRSMKEKHYTGVIYTTLFLTSSVLVYRAVTSA